MGDFNRTRSLTLILSLRHGAQEYSLLLQDGDEGPGRQLSQEPQYLFTNPTRISLCFCVYLATPGVGNEEEMGIPRHNGALVSTSELEAKAKP